MEHIMVNTRTFFFRTVLLLTLTGLLAGTVEAQLFRSTSKVGTTAGQFLKIGVGARAIGMSNAQTGMYRDVSSLYWNAAALSRLQVGTEIMFNHVEWLADMNFDFAGGIINLGSVGMLGFTITSFSVPEDIVRTVEFPEGDGRRWDAGSLALGVVFARNLTDRFSLGVQFKYIRESVWSQSASGVAFDIGTLYLSEIPGLSLGAAISNFGTKMRLDGRDLFFNVDPNDDPGSGPNNIPAQYRTSDFDLPLTFRIGVAYDAIHTENFRVTGALDAVHPNDNTEYVATWMEASWREIIFARVGYKPVPSRDSEEGISWGFGFHYGIVNSLRVKLDYGFADYGRLKNVQYLSLGIGL
jgi:hypothetical protein